MGDGTLYKKSDDHNPNIRVSMIERDYLEWLDKQFGCLTTGVNLYATAQESCDNCKISNNYNPSDYSDVFRVKTRNHPELSRYESWYDAGKKNFPEDIELTETVLTHWYVSDGCFTHPYIRIGMSNEINSRDKIERMFNRVGFEVDRWDISERSDGSHRCAAVFNKEQALDMFDYMDTVGGFDYKFPEE